MTIIVAVIFVFMLMLKFARKISIILLLYSLFFLVGFFCFQQHLVIQLQCYQGLTTISRRKFWHLYPLDVNTDNLFMEIRYNWEGKKYLLNVTAIKTACLTFFLTCWHTLMDLWKPGHNSTLRTTILLLHSSSWTKGWKLQQTGIFTTVNERN